VLRPSPDGVVFGLLGFTVVPPPPPPDCPGTWLSDVPNGLTPGEYIDEDPGVRGWACGRGVAGVRPVAGGMDVAGDTVFGPGVLGAVEVWPADPVVGPGDDSADARGCAGAAFPAGAGGWSGATVPGAGLAGIVCGAGDVGTGATVPKGGVCAAPGAAMITMSAEVVSRHRIVRIDPT